MVGQNKTIINYIQHLGETSLTNKLQDISKTQDPSTQLFPGTRFEDRIACKIGFVEILGNINLQSQMGGWIKMGTKLTQLSTKL